MSISIREGLRQALLANAAVVEVVGQQVWSTFAPIATNPSGTWIVITKISGGSEGAMSGDQGLDHPTFQLTIGGTDKVAIDRLQELLIDFNCTEFTYTVGAVAHVLTFFHKDDRDGWDESSRLYRPTVDLEVWVNT